MEVMDPKVDDSLISIFMKRLYEDNGELPIQKAIHFIRINSPEKMLNTNEDIKYWLIELHSKYFKLKRDVVVGITSARLCEKHCSEPGSCRGGCDKLHVCKFFLLTNEFKCRSNCRFVHDLTTRHNCGVLRKYKLQLLREEHLRCLFRKAENRNQRTLPGICRNFNVGKCEKINCRLLHICNKYFIGRCPFGKRCRVTHLIDSKIMAILNDYGIRLPANVVDGLTELGLMYSADEPSSKRLSRTGSSNNLADNSNEKMKTDCRLGSSMMDLSTCRSRQRRNNINKEARTKRNTGICLKRLSGNPCSSECPFHHKKCRYQWQYKISSDDWRDFDESTNKELEEKYCLLSDEFHAPSKNGFIRYDFQKMQFTNLKTEGNIRRLSTPSSVLHPNNNWSTVWIWYWENDSECWMEYNVDNPESPPVSSSEIEEKYSSDRQGKMQFIHQGIICFIDFKEMFQVTGKKTAVLRRPKLFREINREEDANEPKSKPETKNQRKPRRESTRKESLTNVDRKNDDKSDLMTHFQIVELLKKDSKFQNISKKFNETMGARGAKIVCIESIQNGELLEEYERKKNKMTKKLGNLSSLNEMDLFHGTSWTNIRAISKHGFDVRLSGEAVGIRYGSGCYFTKKADYAHKYATPKDDMYKMLLTKVLVGLSCEGCSRYVRPPLIDSNNKEGDFYDSCVDNEENPDVFVIFANEQMYPAYIISYEMT